MVSVLSKNKKPLMPCHPARARELLRKGLAVVHKIHPFTIRLKKRTDGITQLARIKIDPGAKTTGIALVSGHKVLSFAEINHRTGIKDKIIKRKGYRHRRRNANTRYRAPRFNNRKTSDGWLPPSLQSRVDSIISWSSKLKNLCPIIDCSVETVKFDTQKLQNPEISGIEYQQGTLFGYEVREYLLDKWNRKCAYCGKENVPLEIEHIIPTSRGGSDRISNLTLACRDCNVEKRNMTAEEYGLLKGKDFSHISSQAKKPLKNAAIANSTREAIYRGLSKLFNSIEISTGGRTKYNRTKLGLPKTHYFDALSIGEFAPGAFSNIDKIDILVITCKGRGQYCRTNVNDSGFPTAYLPRIKLRFGFKTGDMVKAIVPKGKYAGVHIGYVAIRTSGYFDIKDDCSARVAQGINAKYLRSIQRFDGYSYVIKKNEAISFLISTGASKMLVCDIGWEAQKQPEN